MRGRLTIGVIGVAVLGLTVVAAATAENYQYKIVASDRAIAQHVALQRADVGGLGGWTGGATKPDRTPETEADRCDGYLPKQSDLVVTGDAQTDYSFHGTEIDTQVSVLRTAAMVDTDWKRQIGYPNYVACQKKIAPKELPKNSHLVSFTKLPYPRYGTKSLAYRAMIDVTTTSGTVRIALDFVAFYRGRTEVSVIISGLAPTAADRAALSALDNRVAAAVAAKAPAG